MSLRQRPPRSNSDRTSPLSSEQRQEILRSREAARMRVARNKAAARNSRVRGANRGKDKPLLDPHGLYGTRTAQRMRAVRRRQNFQKVALSAGVFALMFFGFSRWEASRVGTLNTHSAQRFGGAILSPVVRRGNELAWVERSGVIRVLDVRTNQARRVAQVEFPSSTAPLLSQDSVIVAGEDSVVQSLNKRDGKRIWARKLASGVRLRLLEIQITDEAANPQSIVVATDDGGRISALRSSDGQVLWSRDLRAITGNAVEVPNSKLWIPLGAKLQGRGGLACLDARSGRELTRIDLGAAHIAAPGAGDAPQNRDIVVSAGDDGAVFCYDSQTLKRVWKTFAQPESAASPGAAIVMRGEPLFKTYRWGERIFIGANDGFLRAFDARDGRELWKFDAKNSIVDRPVSLRRKVNGTERDFLISTDVKGVLRVLDAQSGALEWQTSGGATSKGSFTFDDEIRNISSDGRVEQFQLPN